MKNKNKVNQIESTVFDTMRCMMNVALETIKTTMDVEDLENDLKLQGLFKMVQGLCNDALDYGEQMTYVLNQMATQNVEILNKVRMLESKM